MHAVAQRRQGENHRVAVRHGVDLRSRRAVDQQITCVERGEIDPIAEVYLVGRRRCRERAAVAGHRRVHDERPQCAAEPGHVQYIFAARAGRAGHPYGVQAAQLGGMNQQGVTSVRCAVIVDGDRSAGRIEQFDRRVEVVEKLAEPVGRGRRRDHQRISGVDRDVEKVSAGSASVIAAQRTERVRQSEAALRETGTGEDVNRVTGRSAEVDTPLHHRHTKNAAHAGRKRTGDQAAGRINLKNICALTDRCNQRIGAGDGGQPANQAHPGIQGVDVQNVRDGVGDGIKFNDVAPAVVENVDLACHRRQAVKGAGTSLNHVRVDDRSRVWIEFPQHVGSRTVNEKQALTVEGQPVRPSAHRLRRLETVDLRS